MTEKIDEQEGKVPDLEVVAEMILLAHEWLLRSRDADFFFPPRQVPNCLNYHFAAVAWKCHHAACRRVDPCLRWREVVHFVFPRALLLLVRQAQGTQSTPQSTGPVQ